METGAARQTVIMVCPRESQRSRDTCIRKKAPRFRRTFVNAKPFAIQSVELISHVDGVSVEEVAPCHYNRRRRQRKHPVVLFQRDIKIRDFDP